ncbi:MAG TPA: class I SAM-dependent methyltransferase [Methylomirabilota bacterium]|nr:class I SAM-dependent methyltransferase [Methylomirabilota bacterium]
MKAYYHARDREYDDWWLGRGLFAGRPRPGWDDELATLASALRSLPAARTLDIVCGAGFLTRHLSGEVIGLDQSEAMLEVAREQAPQVGFVRSDALELPFAPRSFDRVFTSFFYCHLVDVERLRFLAEVRRVAREIVVVGSRPRGTEPRARWEERVLADGSRWSVYKRVFEKDELFAELGRGRLVHEGRWFVAVSA